MNASCQKAISFFVSRLHVHLYLLGQRRRALLKNSMLRRILTNRLPSDLSTLSPGPDNSCFFFFLIFCYSSCFEHLNCLSPGPVFCFFFFVFYSICPLWASCGPHNSFVCLCVCVCLFVRFLFGHLSCLSRGRACCLSLCFLFVFVFSFATIWFDTSQPWSRQ